jgi:hypothetical protein
MHVPVAIKTTAWVMLATPVESDDGFDEVHCHVRMAGQDVAYAVTDVVAIAVEGLVHEWTSSGEVCRCMRVFKGAVGCTRNEELTHLVWRWSEVVDVLKTIRWGRHVLVGIVVADKVHG